MAEQTGALSVSEFMRFAEKIPNSRLSSFLYCPHELQLTDKLIVKSLSVEKAHKETSGKDKHRKRQEYLAANFAREGTHGARRMPAGSTPRILGAGAPIKSVVSNLQYLIFYL